MIAEFLPLLTAAPACHRMLDSLAADPTAAIDILLAYQKVWKKSGLARQQDEATAASPDWIQQALNPAIAA